MRRVLITLLSAGLLNISTFAQSILPRIVSDSTAGTLTLDCDDPSGSMALIITDTTGTLVAMKNHVRKGTTMDISDLPKGTYIVNVGYGRLYATERITLQ